MSWVDSFLNAAMLMGGMGPVSTIHTDAEKLFAGIYALYCGLILLIAVGITAAPIVHRFLHHFHLEGAHLTFCKIHIAFQESKNRKPSQSELEIMPKRLRNPPI